MSNEETRERIAGGLRALLKEKPLAKITVGEISAAAGVSRQTFYYHFDNIFEIFKWTIESKVRYKVVRGVKTSCFLAAFREWLIAFERERELTTAFFTSPYVVPAHDHLRNELMPVARETIVERIGADLPPDKVEVCASFLVNANLGVLYDWINAGMEVPANKVIGPIHDLLDIILDSEIAEKLNGHAVR